MDPGRPTMEGTARESLGIGRRVLVVGDDKSMRRLLADVLSSAGFEVASAPDGPSGLALLRSSPIDVILLHELKLYGAFGMQGQRYGTMLAMCEAGTLKPGQLVHQKVGLEGVTGVLEAMADYDTTGVVVIDRF